ncbi:MAG: hypothetical protein M3Y05_06905 [Gemmatimonadota bacterium]|nr:hypothetical protein [Gemmatimonadota bacterium]
MPAAARRFVSLVSIVCAAVASAGRAAAQQSTIPHLRWRTLDTRYFRFLFTDDASPWTRDVAARIDAAHDAVAALVGSAPTKRVTVIVEDPNNVSNGFALPLLDHPLIFLWPTPPDPSTPLGTGAWSDQLSIHEFAHIAHLTRESRNPGVRRLTALLPVKFGPVAVHAPRWVTEGYATFVEGRIVRGIGRPHGAWRPAVLRQWAIEGQLPTYGALDGSPRFEGGAMAYLAGSAFLEWLAARNGDSSVVHLWRRMSARTPRSFAEAFVGVYGAPPDELYGVFAAELTHDALDAVDAHGARDGSGRGALLAATADTITAADEGELVQRLHWATGAPALSRDDSLLALVLTDPQHAPRVVILDLNRHAPDSAARLRAARARALDPEDVPAVASRPAALDVIARLDPRGGMSFAEPRFFANRSRLLVTALAARGDGVYRRDLFVWSWKSGDVRRVTHGAGIRHADPSPDGRTAVADRCAGGRCDLVRIDLASGAITTLAVGNRTLLYNRPRFSRDGRAIAFAVQRGDGWRLATMPSEGGAITIVGDARAAAYSPTFARSDADLVVTTETGGVPNIARVERRTGAMTVLTNVSGAAIDPEVSASGWVYFLRLHARGLDLARVRLNAAAPRVDAPRGSFPWVLDQPVTATLDSLSTAPIPKDRSYGLGPREQRLLVSGSWAGEGKALGLAYAGTDPVGKLTWLLQGQWGDRASWRGASIGAVFRGSRPLVGVEAFALENQPSRQHGFDAPPVLDARYRALSAWAELDHDTQSRDLGARAMASVGTVDPLRMPPMQRAVARLSVHAGALQTPRDWRVSERLALAADAGELGDEGWTRGVLTAALAVRGFGHEVEIDGLYGLVSKSAPQFERFALGGLAPPFMDSSLLAQRVPMAALPIASATGSAITTLRVSLPGPIWRPYYWIGSASDDEGSWEQVIGFEGGWHTDGVWLVRVPGVTLLGGIGYALTGPVRHHTQLYASVRYRP